MSKIEKLTAEFEGIQADNLAMSEKRKKLTETLDKINKSLDEDGVDDRFDVLVGKIKHELEYINSIQDGLNEEAKEWREKIKE